MSREQQDYPIPSQFSSLTRNQNGGSLPSLRSQQYESKICELSNQVKLLRDRLHAFEEEKVETAAQEMAALQVENARLARENKALKHRVKQLQERLKYVQGNVGLNSVRSKGDLGRRSGDYDSREYSLKSASSATTTNLLRQLLVSCSEPSQCQTSSSSKPPIPLKDEFYQFKSSQDCFQPWLSHLPKQSKIRLKRCLTRQKQLLFVNKQIEVGCLCPYKGRWEEEGMKCRMMIVVSNVGLGVIRGIRMEILHAKDVSVMGGNGRNKEEEQSVWVYPKESLTPNGQWKEEIFLTINNIDFRCLQLELSYTTSDPHTQLLILPFSKIKLFRTLPYTAPTSKSFNNRIQRVFQHQRKVLSDLDKIGKLWPVYQSNFGSTANSGVRSSTNSQKEGKGKRYFWKAWVMGRTFWIEAGMVDDKVVIAVHYQQERALAEKVLDQYVFLLQKM